jgi:hypothetical protein
MTKEEGPFLCGAKRKPECAGLVVVGGISIHERRRA